jgi:hypothetical protein
VIITTRTKYTSTSCSTGQRAHDEPPMLTRCWTLTGRPQLARCHSYVFGRRHLTTHLSSKAVAMDQSVPKLTPKKKKPTPQVSVDAATLQPKAHKIADKLKELYPNPPIPLDHGSPFQLLVAVMLSAQVCNSLPLSTRASNTCTNWLDESSRRVC